MEYNFKKGCSDLLVNINAAMQSSNRVNMFHLQEIKLQNGMVSILLLDRTNPLSHRLTYKDMYYNLFFLWDLCEVFTAPE